MRYRNGEIPDYSKPSRLSGVFVFLLFASMPIAIIGILSDFIG